MIILKRIFKLSKGVYFMWNSVDNGLPFAGRVRCRAAVAV